MGYHVIKYKRVQVTEEPRTVYRCVRPHANGFRTYAWLLPEDVAVLREKGTTVTPIGTVRLVEYQDTETTNWSDLTVQTHREEWYEHDWSPDADDHDKEGTLSWYPAGRSYLLRTER